MHKLAILSGTIVGALMTSAVAADVPAKVTYNDHVLPIFRNACLNCHNPDKKKAGLDLSTYSAALTGSDTGKILESGNPAGSLLLKCVKQIEEPKMPPKGDRLTDIELAVVEKWIAGKLLETASSKGIVASNNVQLAVVSLTRPDGPPPMPGDLPLEPVVTAKVTNALVALAASPWAPLVAVGGQKQVILYNTDNLQPLGILPFPEGFPAVIRFSRNGELLLTGGGLGGKSGKVVLWDVKTGVRVGSVGDEFDQVLGADVSPNHALVALGGPAKVLKIFATKDGKLLHTLKKHTDWVTAVAFSPDGKFLASGDRNGGVTIWEGATGKEYITLEGHKLTVNALAFMPGVLASASADGTIVLWDVKEGKEMKKWNAHAGGTESVDFTPDGRIVSSGRDKLAKVWDATGKLLLTSPPFEDIALRAVLANERLIAGDWTGQIRVVSVADTKPVGELTSNPPAISVQLAAAQARFAKAEAAVTPLQQAVKAAEAALEKERAAAAAKHSSDIAAAEKRGLDARAQIEALNATAAKMDVLVKERQDRLAELKAAHDKATDPEKGELSKKAEEAATALASAEKEREAVRKELPAKLAGAEKQGTEAGQALEALKKGPAKPAPSAAVTQRLAELSKKFEAQKAEADKLREARAKQKEGSPEFVKANEGVQAKKAELATTEKSLAEAKASAEGPQSSPAEAELAKAKVDLEGASAELAQATVALDRWQRAEAFMIVYNARKALDEKKAKHEELVATAKEALMPIDQTTAEIAATEKSVAEAPKAIEQAEALLAKTRLDSESLSKGVGAAEEAVTALEQKEKAAVEGLAQANAAAPELEKKRKASEAKVAELQKQFDGLTAEVAKRREARGKETPETEAYKAADAKVQETKAQLVALEATRTTESAALEEIKKGHEAALAKTKELQPAAEALKGQIVQAREAVEAARATASAAMKKAATAESALAKLRKDTEAATVNLADLKKKLPEIVAEAKQTKIEAEEGAITMAKELETAQQSLHQVQATFDSRYQPAQKSASAAQGKDSKG